MPNSTLMVVATIAIGLLVLAGPRLFSRLMASIRLTRALADNARAASVPIERYAAFDSRFGVLTPSAVIDERTWDDLYLDAVFRSMDHTISQPGRQYLYHLLRRPGLTHESMPAFDARVRAFDRDPEASRRIRVALAKLSDYRAAELEAVFFGELPPRPALWWAFPLLTLSAVGCLLGGLVWPGLILVWIGVCALNTIAQMLYRPRVQEFVPAMRELPSFMTVARVLGGLSMPGLEQELTQLRDGAARLRPIRRATAWLRFEALGSNEIVGTLYEFANLLFALDLTAFVLTTSHLRAQQAVTQQMFTALGTIDALQSIARWRATLDRWSVPEFTPDGKTIHATALSHPVVPDAVPNDLAVQGTSVLITGSNMSGKTTFVRALGANAVLAQSVATTRASTWRAPVFRIRTSIGQADSLLEGKSYYLAEVESVRRMLVAKDSGVQHLFLLDELFRGTNTSERVAAGYATLAWLHRGDDLVVVATHDVELHGLLGDTWAAYHFREQVQDGTLTFDYRVQPGLSSTRNAIALLEVMRFPADLVADARCALGHRAAAGGGD